MPNYQPTHTSTCRFRFSGSCAKLLYVLSTRYPSMICDGLAPKAYNTVPTIMPPTALTVGGETKGYGRLWIVVG